MRGLIRFWQSTLNHKKWMMDANTREMIQETIRTLKNIQRERDELDRMAVMSDVEKQVEAIRISKKGGS